MASQDLRQRTKEEEPTVSAPPSTTTSNGKRDKRMAMAKRGLRSLTIAVTLPLCLTMATVLISGSVTASKPIWLLPRWFFHLTSLSTTALMGLAAWLVWADGGFHREPATVPLYLSQLLLGLVWQLVVFRVRAVKAGLGVCFLMFLALLGCAKTFKKVNPIAADLVKPCIAWVSYLAILTYKLA